MLKINIPGYGDLEIHHLILDLNGTLSVDGNLLENIPTILNPLSNELTLHVVTGDTYYNANELLRSINCVSIILPVDNQGTEKLNYIQQLGPEQTIAIGNGRNDQQLLKAAKIGIAVIGAEGAAFDAISSADVITTSIYSALDLIRNPKRLVATLRG